MGLGVGSGSTIPGSGSTDLTPHQNEVGPKHGFLFYNLLIFKVNPNKETENLFVGRQTVGYSDHLKNRNNI